MKWLTAAILVLLLSLTVTASDPVREQKLQKAIDLFEAKGDLQSAGALFEDVSQSPDRELASRALIYLAKIQRLQRSPSARLTYERIIAEFASQPEAVAVAKRELATLQEAAPNPPQPSASAPVQGLIIDTTTEMPIAGVRVTLAVEGGPRMAGTSDFYGKFLFSDVPAGRHRLSTDKEGYAAARVPEKRSGMASVPVTVIGGQPIKDLTIRLTPAGVITGRVFDTGGRPIRSARVVLTRYGYDEASGQRQLLGVFDSPSSMAFADDRGVFRLFGINPGEYYVRISPPAFQATPDGEAYASSDFYYPGTVDPDKATPIAVKDSNEIRLSDMTLLSVKAVPIRLRVTNMTGETAPGVRTTVFREKGKTGTGLAGSAKMFGGPDFFELPAVAPGTYIVEVGWQQNPGQYSGRAEINVGATAFEGEVVIKKPGRLEGHVVLQDPGGEVKPLGQVYVSLRGESLSTLYATSGADGTFLMNVPDGDYRLAAPLRLPPDTYLIAMRQGKRDVLAEGLQMAGDSRLDIVIGASGGTVEGAIKNSKGKIIADASVVLVPDAPHQSDGYLFRVGNSDLAGTFAIRGIAPGSYHLFAWTELEGAAYRNPEFMKKYAEQGTALKVTSGAKVTASPRLLDEPRP